MMKLIQRIFGNRLLPRALQAEPISEEEREEIRQRENEELHRRIHDQAARLHYLEIQHEVEKQRAIAAEKSKGTGAAQ